MKVIIQHPKTNFFLDSTNQWTSDFEDARLFDSASEAVTFASYNIKPPYNVVLKFEDPKYDFTVLASGDAGVSQFRTARQ